MKTYNLDNFIKGWFVGKFEPTLFDTEAFEVACKRYEAGDSEESHMHKIATEVTLIAQGEVRMNGQKYVAGDIVVMEPGDWTDFQAISEVMTMVVKFPCVKNDKYYRF